MRAVLHRLRRFALQGDHVLLLGETGTGKGLMARFLHRHSARRQESFVPVDCGALAEGLLDAELFGHARGAFTGAHGERVGLIASAHRGTLFLDEIQNASAALQAKLLSVLEAGEVRALGQESTRRFDVRFVIATNASLEDLVHQGRFRADLLHRLQAFTVRVPALRDRREDIVPLARQFISGPDLPSPSPTLSAELERFLPSFGWPGNVRQLKAAMRAARALCEPGGVLRVVDLPPEIVETANESRMRPDELTLENQVAAYRESVIRSALRASGNVINVAARQLRTPRSTLRRWIGVYGIKLEGDANEETSNRDVRRKPCVLLLDDEPEAIRVASRVLRSSFEIIASDTAEGALVLVEKEHPDVVLADLTLGPSAPDGVSFAESARARGWYLPIALLTSSPSHERATSGRARGIIQDILDKGGAAEELRASLSRLLGNHARSALPN